MFRRDSSKQIVADKVISKGGKTSGRIDSGNRRGKAIISGLRINNLILGSGLGAGAPPSIPPRAQARLNRARHQRMTVPESGGRLPWDGHGVNRLIKGLNGQSRESGSVLIINYQ